MEEARKKAERAEAAKKAAEAAESTSDDEEDGSDEDEVEDDTVDLSNAKVSREKMNLIWGMYLVCNSRFE